MAESRLVARRRELTELIARSTRSEGANATAVEALRLIRYERPTAPLHLHQGVALWLIAVGRKELVLADERFAHGPDECLLISFDLPVVTRVLEASPDAPFLGLTLSLDPAEVASALASHGSDGPILEHADPQRGVSVRPLTLELLDAAVRLVRIARCPRESRALAPLVLDEIRYRLLTGPHAALARQIARVDPRLQAVARATGWLREHYAEPYALATLTLEAGMSASTLHRHFKAVTAMSPLQYHKELRLREARALMLGEGIGAAVAGYRVGYASASQFSRDYRRLFGMPPTRDIARLRDARDAA